MRNLPITLTNLRRKTIKVFVAKCHSYFFQESLKAGFLQNQHNLNFRTLTIPTLHAELIFQTQNNIEPILVMFFFSQLLVVIIGV